MMGRVATPFTYRVLTSLLTPILPWVLRRRLGQGKEDPDRIRERYGRSEIDRPAGQLIWLHGASVGETQMLRTLLPHFLAKQDRHILLTSGTKTSADLLAKQLPPRVIHQYVPVDTPRATARFIAFWRPDLAVFAESELWPNLIWTAKRADIPLALINGRMSEKSLQGWDSRPALAKSVLGAFDLILAADDRTAEGLSALTRINVPNVGNLKLNAPALNFDQDQSQALRNDIGDRPIWLAASTHEAEEEVFFKLADTLKPDAYMIWLPRHPERGRVIADRLGTVTRSKGGKPRGHVYVMDTLGEMGLALSLAKICVLGGSFHPSLMGHNPLEAARAQVPVITGPYHASFVDLYRTMSALNAVSVADERQLTATIRDGLYGRLDEMAINAHGFASQTSATLDRTVKALEQLL